jgi:hypothetical protein
MGLFFLVLTFSIGAGMIFLFKKYANKDDKDKE